MTSKEILLQLLDEVSCELTKLTEADFKKLKSGDYSLSLKLIKKKVVKDRFDLQEEDIQDLFSKLKECKDRESGYSFLSEKLKNRKQLEAFAKGIDVFVMKQDKVDKIRERIVEGVIGATLRSQAIQET